MSITLPQNYRPTEREPFMNAMQQEYFRQKLLKWKGELIEESNQTLQNMQEESLAQPDLADRATAETDRSLELRTRDRFRKLISKIDSALKSIEEGKTISEPLKETGIFPPMVVSMVDVGEQTGALPEMLMKVADNYEEEVDNAVSAMTSLLEPIMIVFLAVVVGSIVIAMFLPLIKLMDSLGGDGDSGGKGKGKGKGKGD